MKLREEYFVTYVNYPLTKNKNKKEHIKFLEGNLVIDTWGVKIDVGNLLKQKFYVDTKETENRRHEIFKSVLTQIVAGKPFNEIDGLGNINDEVIKNQPRIILRGKTGKKGLETITDKKIWNPLNHENEGNRLYNLACHSLMHFLKVRDNIKRLKQCPHCPRFFIAKDLKRKICYGSEECFRKQKSAQKKNLRNKKKERNQNNAAKGL